MLLQAAGTSHTLSAALQVAKNIVLAGIGSVTLVDDTSYVGRDPGNLLIREDQNTSER